MCINSAILALKAYLISDRSHDADWLKGNCVAIDWLLGSSVIAKLLVGNYMAVDWLLGGFETADKLAVDEKC